ncbi:PAS domain S-box protein [Clostridium sp. CM028]|uniref:sensor histidine kinase n=1 Tax=Clostridium sp. CM028 TaxID=2851575 RepID=UPI001C6F5153|nr:ATP-binding protein [Clostridium sp. CM028]MBW9149207.1 PAS domain S-box protein [Clostridium sp. CM028]WLC61195.1 PAS domain S-box protein [Clostridium sp. CM028]
MSNIDGGRKKEINDIISIVKLISLLFCGIVIYNELLISNNKILQNSSGYINIIPTALLSVSSICIYWLWSFFSIRRFKCKYVKLIQIIENLVFIMIFSITIILSNNCTSQYKLLFLFIIVTSTLELGMKNGVTTAVISSGIILVIDLIYAPYTSVNLYFQNDLIMAAVFILTAWPLGHYVEIEKENSYRKNLQLQALNDELKDTDNQRIYIEKILLKNEDCHSLLIENSREAIFVHRNDKVIFVNESAIKLVGLNTQDELIGRLILDFMDIDESENIKEKFDEIYNKQSTLVNFEGKIFKQDGKVANVQNTSTYFTYAGQPVILSIIRDITPEKQVEKLQLDIEKNLQLLNETIKLNKLITEVFTNISHELKTPLNVIYSAIQVLSIYNNTEEFWEKKDEYLVVMKQNCFRLMRLINNFLDITKVDSGLLKPNMVEVNIVSVIENIALSAASYVESKQIQLTFDTDVEEKIMTFDPDKIEKIMLNVLSNSIKYTDCGGKILVALTDKEDSILISVKDTGIGIPEDKLKFVFERFAQIDKTLKRPCEGAGIGLSLVRSFVKMHEGSIEIKSEINIGSEAIIKLPTKTLTKHYVDDEFQYKTSTERINIEFSDIYSDV